MIGRFSPLELFRGHWKGMGDYRKKVVIPDWWARSAFVVVPLAVGGLILWRRAEFGAPAALLTGAALLAGGLLSAFTHLSTLRVRLAERGDAWDEYDQPDRDAFDETAAHLLLASYLAGLTAFLLVLAMNLGRTTTPEGIPDGGITWGWSIPIGVIGTYLFMLFLMTLPRMYNAYATLNKVRPELSGTHAGR